MESKSRQIILHVIGCLAFLSIPLLFAPGPSISWHMLTITPTQRELLSNVLMIGFFYLCTYVLIPRFYFNKDLTLFSVLVVLCYLVITVLPHILISDAFPSTLMADGNNMFDPPGMPMMGQDRPNDLPFVFEFGHTLLRFLVVFFVSLTMSVSGQWQKTQQEKMKAEVSFLKAQINPHFLFNTLNSIYSLAVLKSDKTADAIVKLSEMMRYVINEADKDFVSLEKEIAYINDYIVLQENRFGKSINLSFSVTGDLLGKKIAPLILITFVENAFKYGVNAEDEESVISIKIAVVGNELIMDVVNKKVIVQQSMTEHSGKGIRNAQERLNVLYPSSYILTINDTAEDFSVSLKLLLT
ncbi:MAG TPA: sensor histidine kinase [Cyclobacteriaceae bacterium]